MAKLWTNMKFDQLLVLIMTVVLAVVLFTFGDNQDVVYLILGAFIGAFNANAIKDKEPDKEEFK